MAEVDDNQLRLYQSAYQLLSTLQAHPDTGLELERMVKRTVAPTMQTRDDVAAVYTKPIMERLDAYDKERKQEREDAADRAFMTNLHRVRDKYSLTEDGVKALTTYMKDRTIPDPEDAYLAWKGREPVKPMQPTGMRPSGWGFMDGDSKDDAAMYADPDSYFDNLAANVWNEVTQANNQ